MGMEDVVVLEGEELRFRAENVGEGVSGWTTTEEVHYLLKAKKGLACREVGDDGLQDNE